MCRVRDAPARQHRWPAAGVNCGIQVGPDTGVLKPDAQGVPQVRQVDGALGMARSGQIHRLLTDLNGGIQIPAVTGVLEPGEHEDAQVRQAPRAGRVAGPGRVSHLLAQVNSGVQVGTVPGAPEPGAQGVPQVRQVAGVIGVAWLGSTRRLPPGIDRGVEVSLFSGGLKPPVEAEAEIRQKHPPGRVTGGMTSTACRNTATATSSTSGRPVLSYALTASSASAAHSCRASGRTPSLPNPGDPLIPRPWSALQPTHKR